MSPWEKAWPSQLFVGSWSWGTILKTVPILGSDPPGSRQRQKLVCRKLTGEHDGISSHGPVAGVGSGTWRNWNATKTEWIHCPFSGSRQSSGASMPLQSCSNLKKEGLCTPLDVDCPWRARWLSSAELLPGMGLTESRQLPALPQPTGMVSQPRQHPTAPAAGHS